MYDAGCLNLGFYFTVVYNPDMENKFRNIGMAITTAFVMLNINESFGQNGNLKYEHGVIDPVRTEKRADQNMPSGFQRDQVVGLENGQEKTVASIFWFNEGQTKAHFYTKESNPELFSPKINFEAVNQESRSRGSETVIAFAGAYKNSDGKIEGVAIENGNSVGSSSYSKSGFVYIGPSGKIDLYRLRDESTNSVDKVKADALVSRATAEGGSLYQQIPAIWEGLERVDTHSPGKFEWRAICQTKDGKKFILNCTDKITMRDFLIMALNIKDKTMLHWCMI